MLMEKHGLKEGDYRTVNLIGTGPRAECLSKGECFAAAADQPRDIQLMREGYTRLGDSHEVIPVLQFSVVAARRPWADTHKDVIVRFARAYADGYRFMRDPKNRDSVGRLMVEATDAKPDMVADILKLYYEPDRGVMPRQAEIKMDGIEKVIQLLADSGQIPKPAPPATRFVDLQYLKAAGLQ
jgi:ABC-type nitrate/sulfonate/bicarbonate transport system substrate-binding protein